MRSIDARLRPFDKRLCPDFETFKETGDFGEEVAAAHLRRHGCSILSRNYRSRWGEIDLVVRQEETLCFVEVKSRGPDSWGRPAEAVERSKQRRLIHTAQAYLQELNVPPPTSRFDVVEVILQPGHLPKIEWTQAAFLVENKRSSSL